MGIFKKNKSLEITSPVRGNSLPLNQVPDETFSLEILGSGVAVQPESNQVVAPCDAKVDLMFDTGHAVNLICKKGVELLIHVGIDTVKLKGKYFTPHVKSGDTVKKGDLLITFEKEKIEQEGYPMVIPIVVCSMGPFSAIKSVTDKSVNAGDTILILE